MSSVEKWKQRNKTLREKCPNTEFFWSIFYRIQSKCQKIRARKTLYLDTFHAVKHINPLMHNVPKWSDTLKKTCGKCCKIFKVCLTILGRYALNGLRKKAVISLVIIRISFINQYRIFIQHEFLYL